MGMVEVWHVCPELLGLRPGAVVRCGCRIGPLVWEGEVAEQVCLTCGQCERCCPCVESLIDPSQRGGAPVTPRRAAGGAAKRGWLPSCGEPPLLVLDALSRLF